VDTSLGDKLNITLDMTFHALTCAGTEEGRKEGREGGMEGRGGRSLLSHSKRRCEEKCHSSPFLSS
jgi:hypothetical protein